MDSALDYSITEGEQQGRIASSAEVRDAVELREMHNANRLARHGYRRYNFETGTLDPPEQYDGQGKKDAIGDPSKLPLDLVPRAYIEAAARALDHGARKYSRHNWRRGIPFSEVYAALLRHLTAWNDGQDLDEESGLNHLDHAAACIAFLTEYVSDAGYARCDDRYKGGAV